jgi:NitT/TauT family transport system substrate-binding protein
MARTLLPAAAVSVLLAACARGGPERITLGVPHLPQFGLVFIAEASGYFAARGGGGAAPRDGADALAALAAGEVDAATAYVLRSPDAPGGRLEVLTTLHASTRLTRLLARADRGVARRGPRRQARGRPRGTNGEFFLHTALAYAGIDGPVSVVDLGPAAAVDALAAGEVDAIVTWPPYVYRARSLLDGARVAEIAGEVYAEVSVLAVREETHRARRPALVKLVRALADAERLVEEHPEQAFQALRASFPDSSEEELRETWTGMRLVLE